MKREYFSPDCTFIAVKTYAGVCLQSGQFEVTNESFLPDADDESYF